MHDFYAKYDLFICYFGGKHELSMFLRESAAEITSAVNKSAVFHSYIMMISFKWEGSSTVYLMKKICNILFLLCGVFVVLKMHFFKPVDDYLILEFSHQSSVSGQVVRAGLAG